MDNWDGIAALPKEERRGATKGQVRHTLPSGRKKIGTR